MKAIDTYTLCEKSEATCTAECEDRILALFEVFQMTPNLSKRMCLDKTEVISVVFHKIVEICVRTLAANTRA